MDKSQHNTVMWYSQCEHRHTDKHTHTLNVTGSTDHLTLFMLSCFWSFELAKTTFFSPCNCSCLTTAYTRENCAPTLVTHVHTHTEYTLWTHLTVACAGSAKSILFSTRSFGRPSVLLYLVFRPANGIYYNIVRNHTQHTVWNTRTHCTVIDNYE